MSDRARSLPPINYVLNQADLVRVLRGHDKRGRAPALAQIQARADKFAGDRNRGIADLLSEKQPSRRLSNTSEIGELALWLASKSAHNVTGTAIPIDGGWTAQ